MISESRANAGKVTIHPAGHSLLLLSTKGAKSGRAYTTPLVYHRDGDRFVVIASKGGAPENPGWYHNLVANPRVGIEVGSESFEAIASVATGEDRQRLYRQHASHFAVFNDYARQTTREIPVIVLDRIL